MGRCAGVRVCTRAALDRVMLAAPRQQWLLDESLFAAHRTLMRSHVQISMAHWQSSISAVGLRQEPYFGLRQAITENFESPDEGVLGRLAMWLMESDDSRKSAVDMIRRSGLVKADMIVELGPGHGHFIEAVCNVYGYLCSHCAVTVQSLCSHCI